MKSNNNYIFIYIIFILLFWLLFFYSCFHTKVISVKENYNNNKKRNKLLYKIKYKCNDNQEHAYSPEICCKMKNGIFTCDNNRNCKCKNKDTGYCEECYPPIHKKIMY